MSSSPSLSVSNFSCIRGGQSCFAPVDFHLGAGGTLILRGENGSGKSTLLRSLAGLFTSTTGTMNVDASTLYLGHANALHPFMTVDEHLNFWRGLQPSNSISNQVIVESLGIAALSNKRAAQLSNGQKRRLSFARLLLHPAQCWLLDEPQAALDAGGVSMLHQLLAQHTAQQGMAVIASHDALAINGAATLELKGAA